MSSATASTVVKMLEMLPEELQARVLEHMQQYVEDIREEAKWTTSFSRSQDKLMEVAREARKEIADGKATPLDPECL